METVEVNTAAQSIKLKINSNRQFERVRFVEKMLPQEMLVAFQEKHFMVVAQSDCAEAEKLMPCGMRYSEPFNAKPNFFIPILAVGSYVVPFFMLMAVAFTSKLLPGFVYLSEFLEKHGMQIAMRSRFDDALAMLLLLSAPPVVGGLSAYILSKETKVSLKQKILAWTVVMSIFVVAEVYLGAALKLF